MDLLATAAAQAPPAPRKAKKKSDTFESPVVEEVLPGALNVHSDDPTITVPSHGGDSTARRVKAANPKRPSMDAIQRMAGRGAGARREIEAAAPPRRKRARAAAGTPAGRAPKKAKPLSPDEATLLEFPKGPQTLTPERPLEPVEWKGGLWCPFCLTSGQRKQFCHRIPRATPGPTYKGSKEKLAGISNGKTPHFHQATLNRHLTEDHDFPPLTGRSDYGVRPFTTKSVGRGGNHPNKGGGHPRVKKVHDKDQRWRFKFHRGWRLEFHIRPLKRPKV